MGQWYATRVLFFTEGVSLPNSTAQAMTRDTIGNLPRGGKDEIVVVRGPAADVLAAVIYLTPQGTRVIACIDDFDLASITKIATYPHTIIFLAPLVLSRLLEAIRWLASTGEGIYELLKRKWDSGLIASATGMGVEIVDFLLKENGGGPYVTGSGERCCGSAPF